MLLTNGVDEAIHLVCAALLEEGDETLICTPTFFMYEVSAGMMTAHVRKVQADASLEFPYTRFLQSITPRTKLIMVASPNNPTGAVVSREQLLAICAAAPQAAVLVDEAYYHFFGETVMADVGRVPNLLVARTFSKAYGLASLRIGMLAGSAELMKYVRKVSSPYNVNGVALDCLPVALADDAYVEWYGAQVNAVGGAQDDGLGCGRWASTSFPAIANFMLMKIGAKHAGTGRGDAGSRRASARLARPTRAAMGTCASRWAWRSTWRMLGGAQGIAERNWMGTGQQVLRAVASQSICRGGRKGERDFDETRERLQGPKRKRGGGVVAHRLRAWAQRCQWRSKAIRCLIWGL